MTRSAINFHTMSSFSPLFVQCFPGVFHCEYVSSGCSVLYAAVWVKGRCYVDLCMFVCMCIDMIVHVGDNVMFSISGLLRFWSSPLSVVTVLRITWRLPRRREKRDTETTTMMKRKEC